MLDAATRYVADFRLRDYVASVQRSLHWLPIHQQTEYKLSVLMYMVVNGTAPDYISNSVTPTSAMPMPGRSHFPAADSLMFDIPRTCTRMGDRAISVAGPQTSNFHYTFANRLAWSLLRKKQRTHLFDTKRLVRRILVVFILSFILSLQCRPIAVDVLY